MDKRKNLYGRATNGFDFLGYHLTPGGVSVAQSVIGNAIAHITRLYEQGADSTSIGKYVTRWATWCRSGIRVAGIRQCGEDAEGVV